MSDNGSPIEFYHKNPRQITVQQFENLERWLEELGDLSGVVHDLNSNQIIGGNQRGRVFEINECEIVLTEEYDEPDEQGTVATGYIIWKGYRYTYRQVKWTEHQCEMANIVANRAGGEWDFDILANEFELDDLLNWGFIEHDLDLDLWLPEPPEDPGAQIDRAEELREKWGVETGQLWRLGEHYLACGDCTDPHIRDLATAGDRLELGLHDPPYGIDAPNMTLGLGKKEFLREDFDKERVDVEWLLTESERCIIWGGNYYADILPVNNDWLCWDKKNPNMGYSEFELAWSNLGKNTRLITHHWSGEEKQHPTQKPLPVIEWCLSLVDCEVVCDFYVGSGTTLIACERLGRKCRAVEISPAYCAVAIQRWVDMTGGEPELLGDPHSIEEPSQY